MRTHEQTSRKQNALSCPCHLVPHHLCTSLHLAAAIRLWWSWTLVGTRFPPNARLFVHPRLSANIHPYYAEETRERIIVFLCCQLPTDVRRNFLMLMLSQIAHFQVFRFLFSDNPLLSFKEINLDPDPGPFGCCAGIGRVYIDLHVLLQTWQNRFQLHLTSLYRPVKFQDGSQKRNTKLTTLFQTNTWRLSSFPML